MRGLTTHWRVGHQCYLVCKFPPLPRRPSQVRFKTLQPLAELGTCIIKKTEDSTSLLDGKYSGLQHLVCSRNSSHLWGTNLLQTLPFQRGWESIYHREEEQLPGYRIHWVGLSQLGLRNRVSLSQFILIHFSWPTWIFFTLGAERNVTMQYFH